MSMRFELIGECAAVGIVVAYAPTEANPNPELNKVIWKKFGDLVTQIPTKELLFVQIDANTGTGKRMEGCDDDRVPEAYGRDELNINVKRLLSLASDSKLVFTNAFFCARKVGISHTLNDLDSRDDRKRIDCIPTRQSQRPGVYDVNVHHQPPSLAKKESDITSYTRWSASAIVLRPTDAHAEKHKCSLWICNSFYLTEPAGSRYMRRSFSSFLMYPRNPTEFLRWPSPPPKIFLML